MARTRSAGATGKKPAYAAHYISGTHWDREWYRPVQEFRLLLVEVIDSVLDLMATNDEFRFFHLDGQTCVLRDYVEIRPERRAELQRLMQEGRILVGPWYTMPDLFGPGAEALVRNLLLGRRVARAWNVEPMPVAYTCDMFGHPSQMPQIYRGFGLPHCVLGRGTNEHTTPMYFQWEAPDGSRVFVFKLQDKMGYGAFQGTRLHLERQDGEAPDEAARERAAETLQTYIRHEEERANAPVLCLMDALDHTTPAADVGGYLRLMREACPEVEGQHSTLPAFFAEAEGKAGRVPVRGGELREPARDRCGYNWLIPHCVSSRVRMKQANDRCQMLTERWAEPLMTFANLDGEAVPEGFLQVVWDHILLNHAHDSICGCSIDQVHQDMMYRYDQARVLARQLRHKAFAALTTDCADLAAAEDEFTVTVANPLPQARRETVVLDLDLPPDYPRTFHEGFFSQLLKLFALEDAAGNEVPFQRLAKVPNHQERSAVARPCYQGHGAVERYTVACEMELPALGFASLKVKPSDRLIRPVGTLRTGPTAAANEHLALCVDPDGTLTLTDKASGETYTGLLALEECGEVSDGWFHVSPVADEETLSVGAAAQIAVLHDGPQIVTFQIRLTLEVPARYDRETEQRSARRVPLVVVHRVSLRKGARTVEVETAIENTAEDHRLRLLLPSDCAAAETYLAHHPYDLVERRIALDPETHDWQEMERQEKPFLDLQAVGHGRRGLAFLSGGGLHEGGVIDDARRTMTVTLLRGFRRTVGTAGEPGGQELGGVVHRYALLPYAGELPAAEALAEQVKLAAGLLTRQTGSRRSGYPPLNGSRPPHRSLLALRDGEAVLSAVKPRDSGGGLVVRLWNPTGTTISEGLRFERPVTGVTRLQLSEEPDEDPQAPPARRRGTSVSVKLRPHEILTLAVELGPEE